MTLRTVLGTVALLLCLTTNLPTAHGAPSTVRQPGTPATPRIDLFDKDEDREDRILVQFRKHMTPRRVQ